jgi:hypothetical protein
LPVGGGFFADVELKAAWNGFARTLFRPIAAVLAKLFAACLMSVRLN